MITVLYIWIILHLITTIIMYLLGCREEIANEIVYKFRGESDESLILMFKRAAARNIIVTTIILILMILFL